LCLSTCKKRKVLKCFLYNHYASWENIFYYYVVLTSIISSPAIVDLFRDRLRWNDLVDLWCLFNKLHSLYLSSSLSFVDWIVRSPLSLSLSYSPRNQILHHRSSMIRPSEGRSYKAEFRLLKTISEDVHEQKQTLASAV